jgi:hypothetical protein
MCSDEHKEAYLTNWIAAVTQASLTLINLITFSGNTDRRGRLSTFDLLFTIGCVVKKKNISFHRKSNRIELVSRRRSTVLILPLQ